MKEPIVAWHFLRNDLRLGYKDSRVVKRGEILWASNDRQIELCKHGMHGSLRAIDALNYAPGTIICRTVHHGKLFNGDDKLVSEGREVIWMADATNVILEFAEWCAARYAAARYAAARYAAVRYSAVRYSARYSADAARHVAVASYALAAARYAAGADASYDAAREAQNDKLTAMLCELGQRSPLWPTR